jgi:Raf kinase inhibitor-like YbhB/YbcL family protein
VTETLPWQCGADVGATSASRSDSRLSFISTLEDNLTREENNMNARSLIAKRNRVCVPVAAAVLALSAIVPVKADDHEGALRLHSSTFADGGTLPLSMISDFQVNGLNACTADGSPGGNQSPQLSWHHAPQGTRAFVVIAYDVIASFTHWAVYNIPAQTTSLPAGADIAGAGGALGIVVANDFGDLAYDGPCPPTTLKPFTHRYVFTVYALDAPLPRIPAHQDFPAAGEGLYHSLIAAAREGHVLETASITGFFSAVAP